MGHGAWRDGGSRERVEPRKTLKTRNGIIGRPPVF